MSGPVKTSKVYAVQAQVTQTMFVRVWDWNEGIEEALRENLIVTCADKNGDLVVEGKIRGIVDLHVRVADEVELVSIEEEPKAKAEAA